MDQPHSRSWRLVADLALFGVAYYALGQLGQELVFPSAVASAFWPAAGLAAAVFVLAQRRDWPAFAATLVVSNVLRVGVRGGYQGVLR